jgi:hypothetical protein
MMKWGVWAVLGVALAPVSVARAEEDPAGNWKWTMMFRDQQREVQLTLTRDGEKLTGKLGQGERARDIEEGTFKDDTVSFKVTRERNGNKFTSAYSGKVSGDSIKGTIEFERRGEKQSRPWEATRVK